MPPDFFHTGQPRVCIVGRHEIFAFNRKNGKVPQGKFGKANGYGRKEDEH